MVTLLADFWGNQCCHLGNRDLLARSEGNIFNYKLFARGTAKFLKKSLAMLTKYH